MGKGKLRILEWKNIEAAERKRLFARAGSDVEKVKADVALWIERVRQEGDAALVEYTRKFDNPNFDLKQLRVSEEDIRAAYKALPENVLRIFREQIAISRGFHEKVAESLPRFFEVENVRGMKAGYKRVPVDSAGLYVPAGKAPLPSTAQMLGVAAKAARVPRIAACFPPTARHEAIIVAAKEAGVDEIYRVGGIAAIAALALGTESIRPVAKIAGPGSTYVQTAKLQLAAEVGIDMFSGPSEIMVLADEMADAGFIAADILGQCEHGPDSAAILVTTSRQMAESVVAAIDAQRGVLTRQDTLEKALAGFSAAIIVSNIQEMIDVANEYGAEHLQIMVKDAEKVFEKIRHAGSVFIGNYAPVAAGDYASGANHCLPTGKAVQWASPVSPETFMKSVQFQKLSKEALTALEPIISTVAELEGLTAHKESIRIRVQKPDARDQKKDEKQLQS